MEATLLVVDVTHHGENHISYGAGFSGVIFRKDGDDFYFLTALHALETSGEAKVMYRVLGYKDLTPGEYFRKTDEWPPGGLAGYYSRYPLARLEYSDEAYDLAIMSFTSDGDFSSLPLAKQALESKDPIIAIGNPYRERNLVTYGRVKSLRPFYVKDRPRSLQQPMIRHTAYTAGGSSGSLVLNTSGEIAGITLVGGNDVLNHFRCSCMMPVDRIHQFISDWEAKR